jgi:hypothetical protein
MNILFHLSTSIPLTVLVLQEKTVAVNRVGKVLLIFILGIAMHGVLDAVPHCYPIPAEWDAIAGLGLMVVLFMLVNRSYRLMLTAAMAGTIFPDLVDHATAIINHRLGWQLPVWDKLFPWHWKAYSGSLYNQDCSLSSLYHVILIMLVLFVCWWRKNVLWLLFGR